jgi:prepilin-type N-terminal cleavage/methylation domain-containing protein
MLNKRFITKGLKTKAFGLLEVLISIAISAIVMVGAVAVSSKSIKLVRQNELQDLSNGILLRSLEVARSPVNFDLNSQISGSAPAYFVLVKEFDPESGEDRLALQKVSGGSGEINKCQSGEYRVDILDLSEDLGFVDDDFAEAYTICNQIEIEEKSKDSIRRTFQIRSILVYNLFGQDVKKELISERTEIIN